MPIKKRTMVAGAMAAAVGLAGVGSVGLVSAATSNNPDNSSSTSIVDKIAAKFNLNKSDVQAVFDQDRSEHEADLQAKLQERLAQAVTNGKLTQDQADHITQAMAEIKSLMNDQRPDQLDQATKDQLKVKMDALRTWAQENNVDMRYVGYGGRMGGYMGGHMMGAPTPDDNSGSSSASPGSSVE